MKWVVTTDNPFYPEVVYYETYEEAVSAFEKEKALLETINHDCNLSLSKVEKTEVFKTEDGDE